MTEQELHNARRAELLSGIQTALSGPRIPSAPVPPGPNATQAQKDAYDAAVRDQRVHQTLQKPIGQVTVDERAELLREIRACQERGWQ